MVSGVLDGGTRPTEGGKAGAEARVAAASRAETRSHHRRTIPRAIPGIGWLHKSKDLFEYTWAGACDLESGAMRISLAVKPCPSGGRR